MRDGHLTGFAVARAAEHGTRVGPLYADSPRVALALLTGLTAHSPGRPFALDVPDVNLRAVRLVEDLGFRPTFECARMYTGPVPQLDTGALWANTTLELG